MPDPYFLGLELLILVLFVLSLQHAWSRGPHVVFQLLVGVGYGLLLEYTTIRQLNAYHYGHFLLMIGEVPLMVGVAWGTIIYSVGLASDRTELPNEIRPVLDGLLALNIDMSMDAIAIRLGMWDWGIGFHREYFGVPYANFWAWFWVVFAFSFGLRLASSWRHPLAPWIAPFGAIAMGMLTLLGSNALIVDLIGTAWYHTTIALVLGSAILIIFWLRPRFDNQSASSLVFWVPFGFHVYFLTAGLVSGVIFEPPLILLVSLLMMVIALYLHRNTISTLLRRA
jgi:hypothetical protein